MSLLLSICFQIFLILVRFFRVLMFWLIEDLNKGSMYKSKKMPRRGVYRISKIGRLVDCNGKPTDGWHIAHAIKHALNYVYLDNPISDEEFFNLPIWIYSKYIEVAFK